jgi:hypothetical protein
MVPYGCRGSECLRRTCGSYFGKIGKCLLLQLQLGLDEVSLFHQTKCVNRKYGGCERSRAANGLGT